MLPENHIHRFLMLCFRVTLPENHLHHYFIIIFKLGGSSPMGTTWRHVQLIVCIG